MGNETPPYKNLSLTDLPNEIWKDIEDFEGFYQVSNMGRVKSLEREILCKNGCTKIIKSRILLQSRSTRNVPRISLSIENIITVKEISKLVFCTFNKIKKDKPFILHKNKNRWDNSLNNLYVGNSDELSNNCSRGHMKKNKYRCVTKHKNKDYYSFKILIKGKIIRKGFKTELEAAKEYDYYVKEYKLNRELNFPDEK